MVIYYRRFFIVPFSEKCNMILINDSVISSAEYIIVTRSQHYHTGGFDLANNVLLLSTDLLPEGGSGPD